MIKLQVLYLRLKYFSQKCSLLLRCFLNVRSSMGLFSCRNINKNISMERFNEFDEIEKKLYRTIQEDLFKKKRALFGFEIAIILYKIIVELNEKQKNIL